MFIRSGHSLYDLVREPMRVTVSDLIDTQPCRYGGSWLSVACYGEVYLLASAAKTLRLLLSSR